MTVLKSKLSGYYFKDLGVWTSAPLDAFSFTNEWAARDFVLRQHLEDVQVFEPEVTYKELKVTG